MTRDQDKLITPDTVRAVDREYRDHVMSLRALAALLHDSEAEGEGKAWDPVLANLLDSELNQLAVLMGDVTAALRMEQHATGPVRQIDLSRTLETAVRRSGSRVLVRVAEPVRVAAHPEIAAQAVVSAIALATRIADGRVTAAARNHGDEGMVSISIPAGEDEIHAHRLDARLALLRRIVYAEGGRITLDRKAGHVVVSLSFPSVDARGGTGERDGKSA